jgi:hypothetical protein
MIEVREFEEEALVDREDPVNGTATINITALVVALTMTVCTLPPGRLALCVILYSIRSLKADQSLKISSSDRNTTNEKMGMSMQIVVQTHSG